MLRVLMVRKLEVGGRPCFNDTPPAFPRLTFPLGPDPRLLGCVCPKTAHTHTHTLHTLSAKSRGSPSCPSRCPYTSSALVKMVFARAFSHHLSKPASLLSRAATPQLARAAAPTRFGTTLRRTLTASPSRQVKVLLVLYDVSNAGRPAACGQGRLTRNRATSTQRNSLVCWVPPKTNWACANGWRTEATLW